MPTVTPVNRRSTLPIIDGFVEVPDLNKQVNLRLALADAITAIPGSTVQVNPFITDREQNLYVLPEFDRENQFPEDYYQILRDAAT